VLADFTLFFPHVLAGGIVAFHDVETPVNGNQPWPGVYRVWREVALPKLEKTNYCSTIAFGRKPRIR
jgi:hypothetical protein